MPASTVGRPSRLSPHSHPNSVCPVCLVTSLPRCARHRREGVNGHAVSVNPPAAGHPTFSQSVGGPTQAADSPAPFYTRKKAHSWDPQAARLPLPACSARLSSAARTSGCVALDSNPQPRDIGKYPCSDSGKLYYLREELLPWYPLGCRARRAVSVDRGRVQARPAVSVDRLGPVCLAPGQR